jgi:hypothetical protein
MYALVGIPAGILLVRNDLSRSKTALAWTQNWSDTTMGTRRNGNTRLPRERRRDQSKDDAVGAWRDEYPLSFAMPEGSSQIYFAGGLKEMVEDERDRQA